jgi:hypothetical protein
MNSTPANSKARRTARSLAAVMDFALPAKTALGVALIILASFRKIELAALKIAWHFSFYLYRFHK